jgi:acyl-CoA thioester hydrolase
MRSPIARLDPRAYPYSVAVQTRFADLDVMGHVNNVAIAGLYQEARFRFINEKVYGIAPRPMALPTFLVRLTVNYRSEIVYPGPLQAYVGVLRVGNSSYVLGQALFQDGKYCGSCRSVSVAISPERRAISVPDDFRSRLESLRLSAPRN